MSGKALSKRSFKETKFQKITEERVEDKLQSQKNERKEFLTRIFFVLSRNSFFQLKIRNKHEKRKK